jgi:hypothetical protein
VIDFPSASAQLAFAAGLGREALSPCAEPSAAIKPSVRHPTAKKAYCFLIEILLMPCPSIEPDLQAQRNMELRPTQQTFETATRYQHSISILARAPKRG